MPARLAHRGGPRVFAILGNPVAHSLSPAIQTAALKAARLDGRYVAIACRPEDVAPVMRTLARAGGGGNVTVPHKRRAATVVDDAGDAVVRTGACNTFWGEGERIRGDNTDVEGARRAIRTLLAGSARGARVLLAGAWRDRPSTWSSTRPLWGSAPMIRFPSTSTGSARWEPSWTWCTLLPGRA